MIMIWREKFFSSFSQLILAFWMVGEEGEDRPSESLDRHDRYER